MAVKCGKCGSDIDEDSNFCTKCGAPVTERVRFCIKCGAELDEDSRFCTNCGAPVAGVQVCARHSDNGAAAESATESASSGEPAPIAESASLNEYEKPAESADVDLSTKAQLLKLAAIVAVATCVVLGIFFALS